MSAFRVLIAAGALAALAGCASTGGTGPLAGLFGGDPEPEEAAPAQTFEDFVGGEVAPCPRPEVIQGGAAVRIYRTGRQGANADLRHQIAIVDIARECTISPEGQNVIRVGVQGRVLIGPSGAPGTFTAPVRVVVRTPSTVYENRTQRVSVTVPQGQTLADFTLVEENLRIPLSVGDNFLIEVGLGG